MFVYTVADDRHSLSFSCDVKICEIKYLFPDAKIIFLARDFIDRVWSAMLMELRNSVRGHKPGTFANDEDMDPREKQKYLEEADPNRYDDGYFMERLMHQTHHQRSNYASALRNWLNVFPKEQILILNYDDVSREPRVLLKKVFSFIGTNADFVDSMDDDEISKRFNIASDAKLRKPIRSSLKLKMERVLKPFAQDFNKLLLELGYTWQLSDYSKTSTFNE